MRKALLFLVFGLLGGFAASVWWLQTANEAPPIFTAETKDRARADTETIAAFTHELIERVGALEHEVSELRDELNALSRGTNAPTDATATTETSASSTKETTSDASANPELDRLVRLARLNTEGVRIKALTDAGFSTNRAQEIDRRLQELRVEAMEARYEVARQSDTSMDMRVEDWRYVNPILRAELGDTDYERYLLAMGLSVRVFVVDVLASSLAEQGGLERGDMIFGYDGQRVFDPNELGQMTLNGEPGQPVAVDVLRRGQRLQLVLPRGSLGATTAPFVGQLPK